MLGILKKKFRKAAGGVKKMENRDAVEATVWAHIPLHTLTAPAMRKKLQYWKKPLQHFLPLRRSPVKLPR
jgi:hypothetical protein